MIDGSATSEPISAFDFLLRKVEDFVVIRGSPRVPGNGASRHAGFLDGLGESLDKLARDARLRNLSGELFLDGGCSLVGEGKADQLPRFSAVAKPANCVFDRILRRGLCLAS